MKQRDPWQYIKHQFMKERNHTCVSYVGLALPEDKKWNLMLQQFTRERNPISAQFVMPASLPNTIWHVTLHLLMKRKNPISVCSAVTVFPEKKIWKLMSYQFIEQYLWHVTFDLRAHETIKVCKIVPKSTGWFNHIIFHIYFKIFYSEIDKWIKTWDLS